MIFIKKLIYFNGYLDGEFLIAPELIVIKEPLATSTSQTRRLRSWHKLTQTSNCPCGSLEWLRQVMGKLPLSHKLTPDPTSIAAKIR